MKESCSGCGCIGFHSLGCPYLGKTARSLQTDSAYKEAQARITELEGLVREMEPFVRTGATQAMYSDQYDLHFCAECKEKWGRDHVEGCSVGQAQEIIDRPSVIKIMEVKGG